MERLEAAVRFMRSVLERTAKAPITEVSLLRDRIELQRGYMEARGVLNKHRKRQALQHGDHQQQQEITQAIATSVARRTTGTTIFSIASSLIGPMMKAEPSQRLSCDDIERFERLAGSAKKIIGVVSSCAWLQHRIYFSGPLVFQLFQRETLTHKILEGSQAHCFCIRPFILEGRGVEAQLRYTYNHHEMSRSFGLNLQLRLSESTDTAQVAIKCLQSVAAKFTAEFSLFQLGLLHEPATGALLQLASSQDIVSHAPRWRDPSRGREERYIKSTRLCRPNPVCCTATYGYDEEACAKESQMFPEEVIYLGLRGCISGLELTLPDTKGATVFGDQPPQLHLSALFFPHYMTLVMDSDSRKTIDTMLEGKKEGVAIDGIVGSYSEAIECSIQEAAKKTAKKAIVGLFPMDLNNVSATDLNELSEASLPMNYQVSWFSKGLF